MGFSLNEIEAMGKRAARGAGLAWGIAEEAGKATRWLTARGYPGASLLADTLTRNDKQNYFELAPKDTDSIWQAPAGSLCPLITGVALCDRAVEVANGRVIELGMTAQPLLLAPYIAGAANLTGTSLAISWDDVVMILTPTDIAIDGNHDSLTMRSTDRVLCRKVDELAEPALSSPSSREAGRDVDATTWSRLAAFAQRTFAPSTEASRLSGAGAGLSDNN